MLYKSLQSILSSLMFFHILTIDFMLTLLKSQKDFNYITLIINVFFRKNILILKKITFIVEK